MPAAEPERTVLAVIEDVPDRELRVCLVHFPDFPEWGDFRSIEEYIPSRDLYGRGWVIPEKFASKVGTALRAKRPAE